MTPRFAQNQDVAVKKNWSWKHCSHLHVNERVIQGHVTSENDTLWLDWGGGEESQVAKDKNV